MCSCGGGREREVGEEERAAVLCLIPMDADPIDASGLSSWWRRGQRVQPGPMNLLLGWMILLGLLDILLAT